MESANSHSTVTIREMLSGVKDYSRNFYVNLDGTGNYALEQANTENTGRVRGIYNQMQGIISLLEDADASTFIHEMSHHYLFEVEKLAKEFSKSEAAQDYDVIMKWAKWKEGQAEVYLGTASEKEFLSLDNAIRDAEQRGDHLASERLKNRWAQERFARGFEEYLRIGKAPTPSLQPIFQRFTHWLKQIYRDVTGVGIRPTKDVEAVMDRMVATDDELSVTYGTNKEVQKEETVIAKRDNIPQIPPENNKVDVPMPHDVQIEHHKVLPDNLQNNEDIDLTAFDFSADLTSVSGKRKVFQRNMAAIRTLKRLEEENREALPNEHILLKSYSGFGGLPEVFDEYNKAWTNEYQEIRNALTDEEFSSARASTLNAHYTPTEIVRAIYAAIETMGFKHGNILDEAVA